MKIGDLASIEDMSSRIVIARGPVKEMVESDGKRYYTMDGLYYIDAGNPRYQLNPKDKTKKDEGEYYTKFQRVAGTRYGEFGKCSDADVYIKLSDENVRNTENEIRFVWNKMFPDNDVMMDIQNGRIDFTEIGDCGAVSNLVLDKNNVFGRLFDTTRQGCTLTLTTKSVNPIDRFDDFLRVCEYLDVLIACNFRLMPEEDLLYLNNIGRRSFQWEMWSMCNNLCSYCYLGMANRHTDKDRQMKSLIDCHKAIDNLDTRIYNNVSIIGGEFFQGQLDDPEVHDSFMDLIRKIAKLYANKRIGAIWITCTLTIGDQHHLYEMLEIFKEYGCYPVEGWGSSGLWLCTSWDVQGRFHTPDRKKNWEYHMKNIHEKYPWVKFNTTIILMEKFLQMYVDGEWSPKQFMNEYHTSLFYKQIGLGDIPQDVVEGEFKVDPNDKIGAYRVGKIYVNRTLGFEFAPRRSTMLKFLRKYAVEDPDTYDKLFNIDYRADELHRNYNDSMQDVRTTRNKKSANETDTVVENILNTCGHMINYMPYIDSDKCCMCDKKAIWDLVYGGGM